MADTTVDLPTIVQRMKEAGESQSEIDAVTREYNASKPPSNVSRVSSNEPGTFWGGFGKSISSGEALDAGLKGAVGYGKGMFADLPSTATNMFKQAVSTVNPYDQVMRHYQGIKNLITDPTNPRNYIPGYDTAKDMYDTTMKAGGDPESFGRMMGQTTGQPLVFGGAERAAPYVGPAVEGTGSIMQRYQPLSGLIPRIAEMRTMRNIEAGVGGGIRRFGRYMQTPTRMGEIMYPHSPNWVEGETVPHDTTSMVGPYKQATPVTSESLPRDATPARASLPVNAPLNLPEFAGNRLPPATSPVTTQAGHTPPHLQIEGTPNFEPQAETIGNAQPGGPTKPRVSMKSGMAFEVPQGQISRDFLKKAKAQGFDFAELTSDGNFRFERK